ncbi:MAG TPA: AraC family transcriptional regulator [Ohtaekwangia sp.]|uniref:AraC family transcriptional regulator n=1 Tax=Ohtaekwangia sp. TaxID=2066019 RepID=UPI002F959B69
MLSNDLEYRVVKPDKSLSDFVESFWMLVNHAGIGKDIVVLPDGRIDVFFSQSATKAFHVTLLGLESEPSQTILEPGIITFAVSLRPLAVEYLLKTKVAALVNHGTILPTGIWGITADDLNNFDSFCSKLSNVLIGSIEDKVDSRKQKLFELLYQSNGTIPVAELSRHVYWSSRQINRYFNDQFGLSLKSYSTILRFRASFQQIKDGKLFPDQHFTDQAHFIKEIKKFAGVIPKELSRNKDDRFIQFSTLPKK